MIKDVIANDARWPSPSNNRASKLPGFARTWRECAEFPSGLAIIDVNVLYHSLQTVGQNSAPSWPMVQVAYFRMADDPLGTMGRYGSASRGRSR
jgi:hypothetical protein